MPKPSPNAWEPASKNSSTSRQLHAFGHEGDFCVEDVEDVWPGELARGLWCVFAHASLDSGIVEKAVEIRSEFQWIARVANNSVVERARVIFSGRTAHRDAACGHHFESDEPERLFSAVCK